MSAGAVLFAAGLLDWVTLGAPFRSLIGYIAVNRAGAADYYGVEPWYHYLLVLPWCFGAAIFPLLGFWLSACRTVTGRRPVVVAAAALAGFSFVPHKEARFLLPAYPLLLTAAGIGLARLRGLPGRVGGAAIAVAAASTIALPVGSAKLFIRGTGVTSLMQQAAADTAACGLAIDPPDLWYLTGGLTHLRPGMTLSAWDASRKGAAYVLAPEGRDPGEARLLRCARNMTAGEAAPRVCLWAVKDGCAHGAAPNAPLPWPEFLDGFVPERNPSTRAKSSG